MSEANDQKAYVLMGYGPDDSYETWWHPMGVYTDMTEARSARDEAKRRIPQLELTIETVPLNREISPTDQQGTMWECGFSYEPDGCWQWDPGIYPIEGDELFDRIGEPYDLYRLTSVGEDTDAYYGEAIHVLAESKHQAAEVARPLIDAIVTKETGQPAHCEGWA